MHIYIFDVLYMLLIYPTFFIEIFFFIFQCLWDIINSLSEMKKGIVL